jgi:hypothetical protein
VTTCALMAIQEKGKGMKLCNFIEHPKVPLIVIVVMSVSFNW